MQRKIKIDKIISGGQSGVDRSALDFAIQHTIPHSGWCPRNRWAEDGQIPAIYNLTETLEDNPEFRTLKNVISSDASLIIFKGVKDEGSLKTIEFCKQQHKLFFEFDFSKKVDKKEFNDWLSLNQIRILNIAGPRESNSPGIYQETRSILEYLLLG